MLLKIHPDNPGTRQVKTAVETLGKGGLVIIPTDTIYALACDISSSKAIEQIARIKGVKKAKANFSFLFYDLSQLSEYTKPIPNEVFKLMKSTLPGPYTFILNANNNIPKIFQSNKKTIGIRIPDNNIVASIIKELGNPIMSTSIHDEDEIIEYTTDPGLIYEKYKNLVDVVIDGGFGDNIPSTIIDCTGETIEVIREGKGEI
ncbi:MAG: threonylcarbamoyl-AMP synthase [Bacteroidales bacterium]|nr:threonylcarbamoyl-AMP synthase [Bacteroidales bacterium]